MLLNPFILLNGNAKSAIEFYTSTLGLECSFINTYGNSPLQVPETQKSWILHSELSKDGHPFLMISDIDKTQSGNKIALSLNFTDLNRMRELFEKLSDDGKILMPIEEQFWHAHYGELIDKFGIHWMFNCQKSPS